MTVYTEMDSPIGRLRIAAAEDGLRLIEFERPRYAAPRGSDWRRRETPLLRETRKQLAAYFAGRLRRFDLPLAMRGTDFQRRVWTALCHVPFGATRSYLEIAHQLGHPRATRAVGAANGRNPIPIIVPCHRVVGVDGSLTGYGGGLEVKRFLLRLEGSRNFRARKGHGPDA